MAWEANTASARSCVPSVKLKAVCDFICLVQSTASSFTVERETLFLLCVPSKKLLLTLVHGV